MVQALVQPGDIVLVDRNCHQSHHYGLMLAGAMVTYLEAYPLNQYSMYGAVPLTEIKRQLLALRRAGKLDRVKMLLLTNCTFDGIVYDVGRVMEECLAIKPDLVFLWDEAWFAFARFHPVYRPRTAMRAARTLAERLRLPEYRERYDAQADEVGAIDAADDEVLLSRRLMPDPARARVRVYSTQSTHKTLTSLRQGSMIHVWDQDFSQKVEATFHEAYMTHTSTSPNYQILASLDLGRRQAALEGFELVQKQIENAMRLRDAVDHHPLLSKYMRCLTTADLIPAEYRPTCIDQPLRSGLPNMIKAWDCDEFVLDPSRITIYIGATGIEGDAFKRSHLMDRYGVQINKTSRNTVLFMTTIGTTRSSVAYLIEVLVTIARDLEAQLADMSPAERAAHERAVLRLTAPSAPLPDFSGFHPSFTDGHGQPTPEGDVRRAFYLSYNDSYCEYLTPEEVEQRVENGEQVVSTTYVTPYPPGYPVLVPGQVFSPEILSFMRSLDTPEIHGYRADLGYRVYVDKALEIAATARPAPGRTSARPEAARPRRQPERSARRDDQPGGQQQRVEDDRGGPQHVGVAAGGQRDGAGDARPDGERETPPRQGERQPPPGGPHRDRRGQRQPHHREPPGRHAVQQGEDGRARGVGLGQHLGGLGAQVPGRGHRLAERAEHDPQRRHHDRGAGLVRHQPRPDLGDDDHRGEQADAEHGVAREQQRQPALRRGDVRDQQRAGGGRDHRRDDRHQPAAERVPGADVVPRHHQVRDPAPRSPGRAPSRRATAPSRCRPRAGPIRPRPRTSVPAPTVIRAIAGAPQNCAITGLAA